MEHVLLLGAIAMIAIFHTDHVNRIKALTEEIKKLKDLLNSQGAVAEVKKEVTPVEKTRKPEELQPVKPEIILPKPEVKEVKPVMPDMNVITPQKQAMPTAQEVKKKEEVRVPPPAQPGWWERFKTNNPDLEKFIGENLISKIGVAILVLGIAYFVKYAIDKDWIHETARVAIGILCGGIVMGFAHRLRKRFKGFSSVLVAGAVAIFYFTITIAFQQYHIFGQTLAFAIMVVITAFSVFVSIGYDRIELAALSVVGGFAAPFMVSTGEGNYKVLFTYIIILDAGMLILASLRKWNLVTILAYVFTILLYGSWLSVAISKGGPVPYKGAFVFATGFYVIFLLMTGIHNVRKKSSFSVLELAILLSNTFFYYAAGMIVLSGYHPELKGVFTVILAMINLVIGWLLFKRFHADKKLVYLFLGLTLTFVTLAAPVQLKGNYITLFWAAESVLLVWLAQRTSVLAFRLSSAVVQVLMLVSLVMDWQNVYTLPAAEVPMLINKAFITGISSVIALFAVAWLLRREKESIKAWGAVISLTVFSAFLTWAAVVLLYFVGMFEVTYQGAQYLFSQNSSSALVAMYHLVYTTFVLHLLFRIKTSASTLLSTILSLVNVILFIFVASHAPYEELKEKLELMHGSSVAFALHYVSTACLVYTAWLFARASRTREEPLFAARRVLAWLISAFLVYIASNELLLHGVFFGTSPMQGAGNPYWMETFLHYDDVVRKVLKIGFPILWGLFAFSLLALGIKKPSKDLRILSLALLALTLIKLFTYDIRSVPEAGKIIAFIILGVLLLIMSFMYQKIKAIILEDEAKPQGENENETAR
jgi:uncharacterized membrane protein